MTQPPAGRLNTNRLIVNRPEGMQRSEKSPYQKQIFFHSKLDTRGSTRKSIQNQSEALTDF